MSSDLPLPLFLHALDLFGTMAFAVTGAFKAIEHKSDIVGVIFLASITGLAGGIMRDVIFGRFPPMAVSDPLYIMITTVSGVAIFFLHNRLKRHWNMFLKFDAIGLGVFTVIGASVAYQVTGLNLLAMVFAGIVTAVGGGILRDVFVNEIPIVFVKELYASASFLGVLLFFGLAVAGLDPGIAAVPGMVSATSLRILAIRYGWNLPRPKM